MRRFYWFVDGTSSSGSVTDIPRIIEANPADTDKHPYIVMEDFPSSESYILEDSDHPDSWRDGNDIEHKGGTPVGRALPFDNGVGVRWQAIVYTNSNMLTEPPTKATGPGSSPDSFGYFYSAESCKKRVERICALPVGDKDWASGQMG